MPCAPMPGSGLKRLLLSLLFFALPAAMATVPLHAQSVILDGKGHKWDVHTDGSIADGDNDTFDGALRLYVNGEIFRGGGYRTQRNGREVVVGPWESNGLRVTRKIYVPPKGLYARYVEVVENFGRTTVEVRITLTTDLGGSVRSTSFPSRSENGVAYVGLSQSGTTRNEVGHRFCDNRSDFRVEVTTSGDDVTMTYIKPLRIKPGGRAAIVHAVVQRRSLDDAFEFVEALKSSSLLRAIDPRDRQVLVNLRADALFFMADRELFRGDERRDAIKLDSGETLYGSLSGTPLTIRTDYGRRVLPARGILTILAAPGERHRVVLQSGECLTGRLQDAALGFSLESRKEVAVPLNRVESYGRRVVRRAAEKVEGPDGEASRPREEWLAFTHPVFELRQGDRLIGRPLPTELLVRSAYGDIRFSVDALESIWFPSEARPICMFELRDGSMLSGLLADRKFGVELPGGKVEIPTGRLAAIYFVPDSDPMRVADAEERAQHSAALKMVNGDIFRAMLEGKTGTLGLKTPFGTEYIATPQVKAIRPVKDSSRGVRVTLWDGTVLPGELLSDTLMCTLACGEKLSVPVAMLTSYDDPDALPPMKILDEIRELIPKLAAPNPAVRDGAHRALKKKGPSILGALRRFAKDADPEVRSRVTALLKNLRESAPDDD